MSATRPEAETEYSRGHDGSGSDFRGSDAAGRAGSGPLRAVLTTAGLAGAAVLIGAEFAPLLSVRSSLHPLALSTVSTASHDSYALVPLAVLAGLLAVMVGQTGGRLGLLAIGVLGVAALSVALLGDLPDAQATGVIGNPPIAFARSRPDTGFYLETLGGVLLIITAGAGLLLSGPSRPTAD